MQTNSEPTATTAEAEGTRIAQAQGGCLQGIVPRHSPRFVPVEELPKGEVADDTRWWSDTWRPLNDKEQIETGQRYVVVQTYADKDPNNYRPIPPEMKLLFTDQCEYYVVCPDCRMVYGDMQWSGSTRGGASWRQDAEDDRQEHQRTKGWCQFCDPIFGNGGWSLR